MCFTAAVQPSYDYRTAVDSFTSARMLRSAATKCAVAPDVMHGGRAHPGTAAAQSTTCIPHRPSVQYTRHGSPPRSQTPRVSTAQAQPSRLPRPQSWPSTASEPRFRGAWTCTPSGGGPGAPSATRPRTQPGARAQPANACVACTPHLPRPARQRQRPGPRCELRAHHHVCPTSAPASAQAAAGGPPWMRSSPMTTYG
jgi:hypothetical protein